MPDPQSLIVNHSITHLESGTSKGLGVSWGEHAHQEVLGVRRHPRDHVPIVVDLAARPRRVHWELVWPPDMEDE